jgi:hypothetical protein
MGEPNLANVPDNGQGVCVGAMPPDASAGGVSMTAILDGE